jgi:hypothetical protein
LFGNAFVLVEGIKYLSFAVGGLANEGRGGVREKYLFEPAARKDSLLHLTSFCLTDFCQKLPITLSRIIQNNIGM